MPAKGGAREGICIAYAKCIKQWAVQLMLAWMVSIAQAGDAKVRWVILRRRRIRRSTPTYDPTEPILQHHCAYACFLRAQGIEHPVLKEVQILRNLLVRLWNCHPWELARTVQTCGLSSRTYCEHIKEHMWGGTPDIALLTMAMRSSIVVEDDRGHVLLSIGRSRRVPVMRWTGQYYVIMKNGAMNRRRGASRYRRRLRRTVQRLESSMWSSMCARHLDKDEMEPTCIQDTEVDDVIPGKRKRKTG